MNSGEKYNNYSVSDVTRAKSPAFLALFGGQWAVKLRIIILVKTFNNLQTRTSRAPPVGGQFITLPYFFFLAVHLGSMKPTTALGTAPPVPIRRNFFQTNK